MSICGLSKKLEEVSALVDGVKGKVEELVSDATEGIAAQIDTLKSQLDGKIGQLKGKLEGLIPEIPFDVDFPNLQAEFGNLQNALKDLDVGNASAIIAKMKVTFKDVDIDIDGLVDQLKLDLGNFDPCKSIPNISISLDGPLIKGLPTEIPIKEIEKLTASLEDVSEEVLNKVDGLVDETKKLLEEREKQLFDKGIVIPETIVITTAVMPKFENTPKTVSQKPEIEPRPVGVFGDYDSNFSESGLNTSQWDYRYSKTHNPDGTRKETVSV
jgi:hypothetical protein